MLRFQLEAEIREFWLKNQIREKLEQSRTNAKGNLGYVEGPPHSTASPTLATPVDES